MKINILGTEYDFDATTETKDVRLCGIDGYCDAYEKRIAIESEYNENEPNAIKDFYAHRRKVKRHEVIHAFFFESGLLDYARNEQLADWIAWQFPKMLETFKQVEAL